MAINRYTQPIQHQYMPTHPDARLTGMMLQKKASDQARADQTQAALENEILGTKAYGEQDKARLNEISSAYQEQLGEAYDNYKDDPNALSMALHGIRRNYDKEKLSGDLYNINKNYQIGMETQTDAMKRFGEGKLTQSLYNQQMKNPSSGWKAPETSNPLLTFQEKIATKEYSDSVFSNPEGALDNALDVARSLAGDEYFKYMTEDEQKMFDAKSTRIFKDKYRNDNITNNQSISNAANFRNLDFKNTYKGESVFKDNFVTYDDNGKIDGDNLSAVGKFGKINKNISTSKWIEDDKFISYYATQNKISKAKARSLISEANDYVNGSRITRDFQLLGKYGGAGRYQKSSEFEGIADDYLVWATKNWDPAEDARKLAAEYRSNYPELKGLSDKEVTEKVTNLFDKYSGEFDNIGEIDERFAGVLPDKLHEKGEFAQRIGRDLQVAGREGEFLNTDEMVNELGFSNHKEFFAANQRSGKGVITSNGDIMYELTDSKGERAIITTPPPNNTIKMSFAPSEILSNIIRKGDIGENKFHSFEKTSPTIVSSDGYSFIPDAFEVIPDFNTGNLTINAIEIDNKGNHSRMKHNGENVPIDPNELFESAIYNYISQRVKVKQK